MVDLVPPPEPAVPRVRVLVYDTATGRIQTVIANCPADMAAAQADPARACLSPTQAMEARR